MTNHKITTQEVESILRAVVEDGRIEIVDEKHSIADALQAFFTKVLCDSGWEIGDGQSTCLSEYKEGIGGSYYDLNFHKDFFPVGGIYDVYTLSVCIRFDAYITDFSKYCWKPPETYKADVSFFQFRNVEGVDDMMQIGDRTIIVDRGGDEPIYNGKNFVFRLTDFCKEIMKKIHSYERGFTKSLALVPCKKEQKQ